jgi:hypothetical protein
MNEVAEQNVISANVCEDCTLRKPDGGCRVGSKWRYKKSIRIFSNGGELQIPKKGMLIDE